MNRLVGVLILDMMLFVAHLLAGTISGKVINGTAGYSVPDSLIVYLNRYVQNQPDEDFQVSVAVNNAGEFFVTQLPEDSTMTYEPEVVYRGVKYYGKQVLISRENPNVRSDIHIYEPTSSDTAISVKIHHYIINPAEGFLSIREVLIIENRGDRTFVGKGRASSDKFRTIDHRLPSGAKDLQLGRGLMSCCVEIQSDRFYDTMEILPGMKQVAFFYRLDAPDRKLIISKPITLSTTEFDIIPLHPDLQISGGHLIENPIRDIRMKRYVATHLQPASIITFQITGLPQKPFNFSYIFLIGFSGLLLIVAVLYFVKSTRKQSRSNSIENAEVMESETETPEELIQQIAILDEAFDAGQMDEMQYRERRRALKEKLEELQRRVTEIREENTKS